MIVTCPSCATRYLVDPAALGETGRMVRCAYCTHTWMETPPADMPKRVDVAGAFTEPPPIPPGSNLPALPRQHRATGWIGWAALVVVIALVLGGAVVARDRIVEAWPLAERLYVLVGLVEPTPTAFFDLRNVSQSTSVENERTVLVVTGEIINVSAETRPKPNLVAEFVDSNHRVVERWIVTLANSELAPGETSAFSYRFVDPPKGFVRVNYNLSNGG